MQAQIRLAPGADGGHPAFAGYQRPNPESEPIGVYDDVQHAELLDDGVVAISAGGEHDDTLGVGFIRGLVSHGDPISACLRVPSPRLSSGVSEADIRVGAAEGGLDVWFSGIYRAEWDGETVRIRGAGDDLTAVSHAYIRAGGPRVVSPDP